MILVEIIQGNVTIIKLLRQYEIQNNMCDIQVNKLDLHDTLIR
jgi:hypothetical protein